MGGGGVEAILPCRETSRTPPLFSKLTRLSYSTQWCQAALPSQHRFLVIHPNTGRGWEAVTEPPAGAAGKPLQGHGGRVKNGQWMLCSVAVPPQFPSALPWSPVLTLRARGRHATWLGQPQKLVPTQGSSMTNAGRWSKQARPVVCSGLDSGLSTDELGG